MGGCRDFEQSGSMLPNGVLPSGVARVTRVIDVNRWSVAEERAAVLIAQVQPTGVSEERRQAVADYVKRLITKCTSCKVFTYGSVPLKTYLSDGDIDLTAFGEDGSLKDTWANDVCEVLENEEKNENAEFHVKEVQYIQAEVKLIKCLVEDIVVDISFNQLGGLCTLCFLDEVDRLVNHDHLFKRSIILAKAWCYYESRILGAHHGLISTYALETLVLYIFHLFNNSFAGPLEVLYRFLEFFSNFDWDNYCISLQGPVPITSLPDMTPQPPRRDSGRLLLNKFYLDAYSATYAVPTISLENKSQPFVSKHFNIVDPLRANNNLGRSVNKGNFFRIRSAFTFGARRLAKLLECSEGEIITEVDEFFKNTWQRHGTEHRLDATPIMWGTVSVDKTKLHSSIKTTTRKHEDLFRGIHECKQGLSSDPSCHVPKTIGVNQQSLSTQRKRSTSATYRQGSPTSSLNFKVANAVSNNIAKENYISDNTKKYGMTVLSMDRNGSKKRLHFTRKHSTLGMPCPTDAVLPQDGCARVQEARNDENFRYCLDIGSNREKLIPSASRNDLAKFSDNSVPSVSRLSQHNAEKSISSLNTNYHHAYAGPNGEDDASASELSSVQHGINQYEQEQGLVNMMASCNMHNANERVPLGINCTQQPFSLHPFVLMPVGSNGVNTTGVGPPDLPMAELSCASNIHFQQGVASPSYSYLRTSGLNSDAEETADSCSGNSGMMEKSGFCSSEMNLIFQPNCANTVQDSQMLRSCDRQEPQSESVSPSQSSGGMHGDYGENDKLGCVNYVSSFPNRNSRHKDAYAPCRNYSVYVPVSQVSASSSKLNSQTSVDGTGRSSIAGREKRGRKVSPSPVLTYLYGRSKSDWPRESSLGQTSVKADYGTLSHSTIHHSSEYGPGQMSEQHSVSSSALAVATAVRGGRNYPTGPPLPFLTMLPGHNLQSEINKSRGSTKIFHDDVHLGPCPDNTSNYNDHSEEPGVREVHVSSALRNNGHEFQEHNLDILNSDFTSHWENLQFARSCQGIHQCGYPSPNMGKPVYHTG